MPERRLTIREIATGEMFDVLGPALHACTGEPLTIYRSLKDDRVLARPTSEFRRVFILEYFSDTQPRTDQQAPPLPQDQTLSPAMRRELEEAIRAAEHPTGASLHDGKARVDAQILRRLLAAASEPDPATKEHGDDRLR